MIVQLNEMGVEVLNSYEITKPPLWSVLVMGILAALFIGCALLTWRCMSLNTSWKWIIISFCITIASVVGAGLLAHTVEEDGTGKYVYECTIPEDASFTTIYEHYNVVERRGEIWVLQDK